MKHLFAVVSVFAVLFSVFGAVSADEKRTYQKIPDSITTPESIETKVGTLKLKDGVPTKETAELLLDNLDLSRGWMPS